MTVMQDSVANNLQVLVLWSMIMCTCGYLYQKDYKLDGQGILLPFRLQLVLFVHFVIIFSIRYASNSTHFSYIVWAATLSCLFYPYLRKPSSFILYCQGNNFCRAWKEKLIISSSFYMLGFAFYAALGYYQLATTCLITTAASMLYHRHREGKFFNLDNVFAANHMFVFAYTWYHAVSNDSVYFGCGMVGLPLSIFFLQHCGDPAIIEKVGDVSFVRCSSGVYDEWHTYWHVVSALGPCMSAYYLHKHNLLGDGDTDRIQNESLLLIYVTCISVLMNVLANLAKIVPFR